MIVLDASAAVNLLLGIEPRASAIETRLSAETDGICAPHLLDVEVVQVLRRLVLRREIGARRAELALEDFLALPILRHSHSQLLVRAFELRENVTLYDAIYLVLAEALGATLLTSDAALAQVAGHRVRVDVV